MNSANKNIFFISGISRFLDLYHCVVSEGKERGSYFCHAFNSFVMDYDRHVVVLAGSSGEVESFLMSFLICVVCFLNDLIFLMMM